MNMPKIRRKIIEINEDLCTGCGACIPGCPEQAIQLVETPKGKKARLVKDIYCDGLGACLGTCPEGAITITEKEAEPYDDKATIERIKKLAPELLETHISHIEEHAEELAAMNSNPTSLHVHSCPSASVLQWNNEAGENEPPIQFKSELHQWPVQLQLVPASAPFFKDADLAFVADCVPIAYPNFHQDFLKNKAIAICCPKLDDIKDYISKIAQIIKIAKPKSIQVIYMTVPCCFGLKLMVESAMKEVKLNIPLNEVIIGIKGEKKVVRNQ